MKESLPSPIEELNHGVAEAYGLQLELSRWETDAYPGFHPEGPQGLIDPILKIVDCDLLIGILWKRFGTPTANGKTGTEHEFTTAYEAWKKKGSPQIFFYFSQKPHSPNSIAEIEQWGKVIAFRDQFPKEGLWWPYKGKPRFEKLVRKHLTNYIRTTRLNSDGGDSYTISVASAYSQVERLQKKENFPTAKVVRAWFDTVINPMISDLERERKAIGKKRPVWNQWTRTTEDLGPLQSRSENFSQFLLSHPQTLNLLEGHDAAVRNLINKVNEYYEAVLNSAELNQIYAEMTQPEQIQKARLAYPHAFSYAPDDEQYLQSVLGPREYHLGTLAEAIVNERKEESPGSGWGPAPFWNVHRGALIDIVKSERLSGYRDKTEQARTELAAIIESTAQHLFDIREQLGQKHGEPYAIDSPSTDRYSSFRKY